MVIWGMVYYCFTMFYPQLFLVQPFRPPFFDAEISRATPLSRARRTAPEVFRDPGRGGTRDPSRSGS